MLEDMNNRALILHLEEKLKELRKQLDELVDIFYILKSRKFEDN